MSVTEGRRGGGVTEGRRGGGVTEGRRCDKGGGVRREVV